MVFTTFCVLNYLCGPSISYLSTRQEGPQIQVVYLNYLLQHPCYITMHCTWHGNKYLLNYCVKPHRGRMDKKWTMRITVKRLVDELILKTCKEIWGSNDTEWKKGTVGHLERPCSGVWDENKGFWASGEKTWRPRGKTVTGPGSEGILPDKWKKC